MATVTALPVIKSHEHVSRAIDYVRAPTDINAHEKSYKSTCINCINDDTLAAQFYQTRALYNSDSGILTHHYVQSFAPDEKITPEEAHEIGVELARKTMPGYQVLVSTHIDRDHIHNHMLINSVNLKTGYKWHGNQNTLYDLRAESDEICRRHNLSVLENGTGKIKKGIDRTTYLMALKGTSWKVALTDDLDEAVGKCKSKNDFMEFMKKRGYEITYRNKNITVQPIGEKKKIRVDTLARQFGDKYKKSELEKRMGYYEEVQNSNTEKTKAKGTAKKKHNTEYQRYEKWFFSKINLSEFATAAEKIKSSAVCQIKYFAAKCNAKIKRMHGESRTVRPPVLRHTSPVKSIVRPIMYAGNIRYKNLNDLAGRNITINIAVNDLLNLVGVPVFYACRINSKTKIATVTFKECNAEKIAKAINMTADEIIRQSDKIENNRIYRSLKTTAAKNGEKPMYRIIDSEQLNALRQTNIKFAVFAQGDKFSITILPADSKTVDDVICSVRKETEFEYNRRINRELKAEAAKGGVDMRYKIISKNQLSLISKSDIKFAYFEKNGKFNISYLASDEANINRLLYDSGRKI